MLPPFRRVSCGKWLVTLAISDHLKSVKDLGYLKLGFHPCEVRYDLTSSPLLLGYSSSGAPTKAIGID